jgi:ceramide glucosyltransferase
LIVFVLLMTGLFALGYQLLALAASLNFARRAAQALGRPPDGYTPPVSILKPVCGLDEGFAAAIRSHALQDYPEFEILFGVHTADDPAIAAIQSLQAEFPHVPMRLVLNTSRAANHKVGTLIDLAREARHPVLLVNDSDISVPRDYLRRVVQPLGDATTALTTCLYRPTAASRAARWEVLGIATDFIPSTLVAPLVGVREFGLGSTLCFRAADLRARGGFESIADYIADDYQLAKRLTAGGRRAQLSEVVVETSFGDATWREVWRHQLRWARTIRVSRQDGYAGLPLTHAGLWAVLCAAAGLWSLALPLVAARIAAGLAAGVGVLGIRRLAWFAPLLPVWDLWAFTVWLAGLAGSRIDWRGQRMRLGRDGRLARDDQR